MCRGGRPQGSSLRCGRRRRRVWRRASITFPDSPGNHAGGHRWGRTWKHPPTGDRRGTPCGCPPGSHRSPAGWSNRATGPARGPVTTCGGRRRVQGEGDHKGRPYDAVAAGDAFGAGCRSPSPIPQEIMPEGTGGGGPGNVRRPGTVGASLVGALRGRNVRLLGGRAAQPGRQGARPRLVVCDAVCRGGRPQGSPLRCGHRGGRVWGRASITFPNSPGNRAGGHRWGRTNVGRPGTVGAPLVGALRRRIVRLLGGGAAQPGRQGVRSRPAVGAVRKGGGPQGRPLRSKSGPERHVWGDANVGLIGRCRTAGTIRRSTIAAQSG